MGFDLGSLVPAALGFAVGGPLGAAMGLEGTAASVAGGALAGGLGSSAMGGNFLSGALGGGLGGYGATPGAFQSLSPYLGTVPAVAEGMPLDQALLSNTAQVMGVSGGMPSSFTDFFGSLGAGTDMGGAQGLSFGSAGSGLGGAGMEGLGAGLTAGGYGGGYELFGAPAAGSGLGGAGMEGMGAGLTSGAGTAAGGGSYWDMLRQRMGQLGMKQGLGALQLAGGLQQYQAQAQRQAQQQGYARQMQQLMANPGSVESLPGYQSGLRAVQRKARAEGFGGSGSMAAALAGYGGQQYQQQLSNLAALQGASQPVGSPMMGLVGAGTGAYNLFGGGGGGAGAAPNLYSLFG